MGENVRPYMGKWGMVAGSKEHLDYIQSRRGAESDINAIFDTFLERKPKSVELEGGVMFETREMGGGRYSASWTHKDSSENALILNGLGTSAVEVFLLGRYFASGGVNLYSVDRGGSGLNALADCSPESWERGVLEVSAQFERPVLMSQCFSTGLAADVVDKNKNNFRKIVYLTPNFHLKFGPSFAEKIGIGANFLVGRNAHHRNPVPFEAYLEDKNQLEIIRDDPLFTYGPITFTLMYGNSLVRKAVKKIANSGLETWVVLAGGDKLVDNEKTLATIEKIEQIGQNSIRALIPGAAHYLPLQKIVFENLLNIAKK